MFSTKLFVRINDRYIPRAKYEKDLKKGDQKGACHSPRPLRSPPARDENNINSSKAK